MGFLKSSLKGALVAKVASEARKPKNQAKAKSVLSSLRRRVSGQGSATPVRGRGTTTRAATTKGSVTKGSARKATTRVR